ncbi:hypothetical protein [Peptoniphilus gorbachii]|uniref:Uncharacterized protein n=1 Tax=Peptoniphilus gorbachii TaxID=411567 RepID=A0ABS2MHX1_9FIRM|nr:hypothetical protein [Peptoniphilus gorbachii]MBM7549597.1 hypothetical protein [Peptoniphilus gorbachii]
MGKWIKDEELDLLDMVFEEDHLIPRNQKGYNKDGTIKPGKGFKLRHLSLYNSNTKAITNLCRNLEEVKFNNTIDHQYTEILRKCGLITKTEEVTKYGDMLLKIIHYNNNEIINKINQVTSVKALPEYIPYTVEFFLFCVISKLLNDKDECEDNDIIQGDLFSEPINNIEYFFVNIIDTMKEPSNNKVDLHEFFNFDNDDFYYTMQAMNFTGYEVKRLFRMEKDKINKTWESYYKILESVSKIDALTLKNLTDREEKYYNYSNYFKKQVQKDVRNRVKLSLYSYILLNSIKVSRNKVKIIKNYNYEYLISYDEIKDIAEKYNLLDVYRLVFLESDSKYITNVIKPLAVDPKKIDLSKNNNIVNISVDSRVQQAINIGDVVIFTNTTIDDILYPSTYLVEDITSIGNSELELRLSKKNPINIDKKEQIINDIKE